MPPTMADSNFVDPTILQLISERKQAIWLTIGTLNEEMGYPDRALSAYEACLTHNQQNVKALFKAGSLHMRKDSISAAIQFLCTAVSLAPDNADAWKNLAYSYVMAERFDEGYQAYWTAFAKLRDYRDPFLWYGVGTLYDRLGMLDQALVAFRAVLDMSPTYERMDEVLYSIGLIYKEQSNYNAAYQYMARIISLNSSANAQAEAWYQLGTLQDITGNMRPALDAYHNAMSRNQNHIKAMQALSWLYHRNGNDTEAVELLQRTLRMDENNAESYYLVGRIYMANSEFRVAYENYQRAVHLDDKNAFFWCSIASLYYQKAQHRDAMDAYSVAIHINSDIPEVWYDLGTLYEMYNQLNDAIDSYRRAQQLQPQNAAIMKRLQAVQTAVVNGTAPPRPTGKPACDGQDIIPIMRSSRRPHYNSEAPSRYGPLPPPPAITPSATQATASNIHATTTANTTALLTNTTSAGRTAQVTSQPVTGVASMPQAAVYGPSRIPGASNGPVQTVPNVTEMGPESSRVTTYDRTSQSLPSVARPTNSSVAHMDRVRTENVPSSVPTGIGVPSITVSGVSGPLQRSISAPGSAPLGPISPNLRAIGSVSPATTTAPYSQAPSGHRQVVSINKPEQLNVGTIGPRLRPQDTSRIPGHTSVVHEQRPRVENSWKNSNGDIVNDASKTQSHPSEARDPSGQAIRGEHLDNGRSTIPSTSQIGTTGAMSSSIPQYANGHENNSQNQSYGVQQQTTQGIPSYRVNDVSRQGTVQSTTSVGIGSSAPPVGPISSETHTIRPNSHQSGKELGTPQGPPSHSGDIPQKTGIVSKPIDGHQRNPTLTSSQNSNYQGTQSTGTPSRSGQLNAGDSAAKVNKPVDEENLPRLSPLPSSSTRPMEMKRDGGNETKEQTDGSSQHVSGGVPLGDGTRSNNLMAMAGHDNGQRNSAGSDGQRSRVAQRNSFNSIMQKPAITQARVYKNQGFPEFNGSRDNTAYGKPTVSGTQEPGSQKGFPEANRGSGVENGANVQGGSPIGNGRGKSEDGKSPRQFGGNEESQARGQGYTASPMPSKIPDPGTSGPAGFPGRLKPDNKGMINQSAHDGGPFQGGGRPSIHPPYETGSNPRDKMDRSVPHRVVQATGIRSSPAIGGGPVVPKKRPFQRGDGKPGEETDPDGSNDSHKIARVSSLRNPFGSGAPPSFSKPAPRSVGSGGLNIPAIREPGNHEGGDRSTVSNTPSLKNAVSGGLNVSGRDSKRETAPTLGKRSLTAFENSAHRPGENNEYGRYGGMPKSSVIAPSIESRVHPTNVELQEPRFHGNSNQYMSGMNGNQDLKREKKTDQESQKRFRGSEL